jgi:hypothetical protein
VEQSPQFLRPQNGLLHQHRMMMMMMNDDDYAAVSGMSDIICKLRGFHGGDYEEWCVLGCYAVWLL